MRHRCARILFAGAALLTWPGTSASAAAAGMMDAADGASPPASAGVDGARIDDMPSTVSPAIARFLRENGDRPIPAVPAARPPSAVAPGSGRPPIGPSPGPPSPLAVRPDIPQPPSGGGASPGLPPQPSPPQDNRPFANSPFVTPAPPGGDALAAAGLELKAAPFEPTDLRFPINLAAALRLSDARPLIVAAAQAGVWTAEADLMRAKVLWVPSALFGVDYTRHDGGGPDFNKGVMTAASVNYFMGGGGLGLYVNVTDAVFEPLVARQALNAAHWDVQASKNDALFQAADAYFRVHQYRGMYAGALYTVEYGRLLIDKIQALSRELVPLDEVDRARNMVADLEQRAVLARQEWRVASADLTQVLRLDPRAVLEPQEHDHAQITIIDPGRTLDDLMPIALANRPELSSRRASLLAAEARIRREKMRPLLPLLTVNGFQHPGFTMQGGVFGLGPNSSLNQFVGRNDVTLGVFWQLEGLGIGNLARIKQQRGLESDSIIRLRRQQDLVAADVTRALARVQSAAARVLQADRALRTGIVTFIGHLEGLGQTRRLENVLILTFRPQEAVYSLDMLNVAFNEYFTTVAEYNRAQFDLFHALGYPARELSQLRPVGTPLPVDTERPVYLPGVGVGPPPATR
ncbi:Outer membrane efflux protein [Aquisphaera giovannonii]|uniref:Outer membrane efflux protein n=1 Tax=Aquisphaera giovannonii TaxID=406548 RepID=A0A5B9W2I5_9BACT|nr:TolC family protein [Aquisphaera giovannonii]QEH34499.1 Outer membrane efflux protein [Aquisphaera giovannonii]